MGGPCDGVLIMGTYYNIGGWKTFLPTDSEGNFREGMRPKAVLPSLMRDITFNDMERGWGVERPWDTSGNDPLKGLKWSTKVRNMEEQLVKRVEAQKAEQRAKQALIDAQRREKLDALDPESQSKQRRAWALQDEYERAAMEKRSLIEREEDLKRMRAGSGSYGRSKTLSPAPGSNYRNRKR